MSESVAAPSAPPAPRRTAWLVFASALVLRLLYLWESADAPTFFAPIIDAETYATLARSALTTGTFDPAFFWQPFFYPAFLTAVFALSQGALLFAKILQAAIGAGTCLLTFQLAHRLLPRPWPLVAGLAAAAYGPLIFYDGELLGTGWEALLAPALILCLLDAAGSVAWRRWAVLGLAAGLSCVARPTFVPFVAAGCTWAIWSLRRHPHLTRRRAILAAAALLAGLSLPMAPVAVVSQRVTGQASIMPYSGGLNLYIGNNPSSESTIAIRPGWEWDNLTLLPARFGIAPGRETSRFFSQQALGYVREHPLDFARGLLRKTIQFCSTRELPRNEDLYVFHEWSRLMRLLVWRVGPVGFPFALLLPFALLGLWHLGRRTPAPLLLFLLLYPAAVILVFVTARYRIPVIPILIVCAAAGAAGLFESHRRAPRRTPAILLALLAVALAASAAGPFPQERGHYHAEMYYCLGARQSRAGNLPEARRLLERAIALHPEYADAHNSLGVAAEHMGNQNEAIAHYRRAMEANSRHVTARANLAGALYRTENFPAAATQYSILTGLAPRNSTYRNQLAMALLRQNQTQAAITVFYEALQIDPNDAAIHNNLGSALNGLGRTEEAIEHFEAAILLNPDLDQAILNLGAMLRGHGHPEQSRILYRAALERASAHGQAERARLYQRELDSLATP